MVIERGLHPGGRHAGDRWLSEAIWKSINGRSSKRLAPLHKKIIGSQPVGMGGE
jgi:phospholipase C